MDIAKSIDSVPLAAGFFAPMLAPMLALMAGAKNRGSCPEISDEYWMLLGCARALDDQPSGRAFLQKGSVALNAVPDVARFFEALASERRMRLCKELNKVLAKSMSRTLPDAFATFPALAEFDLSGGDGHFHAAAVHDRRDADGTRHATGHLYLLNLRSQAMRHLDLCDPITRRKEQPA